MRWKFYTHWIACLKVPEINSTQLRSKILLFGRLSSIWRSRMKRNLTVIGFRLVVDTLITLLRFQCDQKTVWPRQSGAVLVVVVSVCGRLFLFLSSLVKYDVTSIKPRPRPRYSLLWLPLAESSVNSAQSYKTGPAFDGRPSRAAMAEAGSRSGRI